MPVRSGIWSGARCAAAIGIGAASLYAALAGYTWLTYGRVRTPRRKDDTDPLIDRFMPVCEVAERHDIPVGAPAVIALTAACDLDFNRPSVIRAVIRARQLALSGKTERMLVRHKMLSMLKATGWTVLAEIPGHEIVLGTVTRPWVANVVFHPIPAEDFAAFREPGWVKIVTTFRADAIGSHQSLASTETRAAATDPITREKFRCYWAFALPGIRLIRRVLLKAAKREAERQMRRTASSTSSAISE